MSEREQGPRARRVERQGFQRAPGAPAPSWGALVGLLAGSVAGVDARESSETWGPGDAWTAARVELRHKVWSIRIASILPVSLMAPGVEVATMPAGERVVIGVAAPAGEGLPAEALAAVASVLEAQGYRPLPGAATEWPDLDAILGDP